MRMFTKALLVAAAATLLTAGTASASSLTFQLTSDHCSGTNGCIPVDGASAGTVMVTDNGGGILVFAVTLNSGYGFVNTGFDATFGFNLNGDPSITYSSVTSGFNVVGTNPQSAGTLHMDGTGDFEYGLLWHLQGGGAATPGPLNFTISASGLSLASLQANSPQGQFFAVDVIGPNGNTGGVDASVPSTVPDGGTTAGLLGLGMLGLGYLRRRIG